MMDKTKFLSPGEVHGPFQIDEFGEVYIREVPADAAGVVYQADEANMMDGSIRIIIASVCDADGKPVFDESDYDALASVPAMRLAKLMQLATEHSGFGEDPQEIAGN